MTVAVVLFVVGLVHGRLTVAGRRRVPGPRVIDPTAARPPARRAADRPRHRRPSASSLALLAVESGWFYANSQWDKVERVDVDVDGESVLAGDSGGTNYLLVGTDNRPGVEGNRSDTMLVLRTGDGPARIMSIPRDLLVTIPPATTGASCTASTPPTTTARSPSSGRCRSRVGIPIDRYIEINFVSFGDLVDALGGVTINFPHPAFDAKSGLNVEQSGPVQLERRAGPGLRPQPHLHRGHRRLDRHRPDRRPRPGGAPADVPAGRAGRGRDRAATRSPSTTSAPSLIGGLRVDNHMELLDAPALRVADGRPRPAADRAADRHRRAVPAAWSSPRPKPSSTTSRS